MPSAWAYCAGVSVLLAGCGAAAPPPADMGASVVVGEQWATAADSGMAAVFGVLTNRGDTPARITSGTSPAAGRVEVHEMVMGSAGAMTMRPMVDGLEVPAGGSRELSPGGDHLMLMDLREPLTPGRDVTLVLDFADGSTLPLTAQVRDFAGGDEEYTPAADHHSHG